MAAVPAISPHNYAVVYIDMEGLPTIPRPGPGNLLSGCAIFQWYCYTSMNVLYTAHSLGVYTAVIKLLIHFDYTTAHWAAKVISDLLLYYS